MQGRRRESAGQNARLPPIAPRQDHPQSDAIPSGPINPEVRRNRLPPRSRSGCWTCRTRKVKCDELRPACGQCIRLGHTCDYNPRLAFRDDTQRVLERMQQDVSTSGHTIWDPEATTQHRDPRPATEVDDSLPPFSFLTTDEERERKAETRDPGSYYVLVNPDSFASLPEYRDENSPASDSFPPNSGHLQSVFGTIVAEVDDPDIVVLKTFEEPSIPSRKGSGPSSSRLELLSTSPESYTELRRKSQSIVQSYPVHTNTHTVPLLNVSDTGSRDSELLHHYRTVISPLLSKTQDLAGGEDIFEVQAKTYPALYHAMMALSALSMAHKNHIQSADALDALEHYQKVIPALKSTVQSTEDSYSDGAFLSHYILLLYEMATAGNRESNMWQHHSDQLLRIITLRRQAQLEEPYDSIVWSIFVIDVYALLSTTGNGSFVNALRAKNMLPAPERGIDSFPLHRLDARQTEEQPYFPALVQLNQEILLLATHVGQTARKLRSEAQTIFSTPADLSAEAAYFTDCRTKVQELQQMIEDTRSSLKARFPDYWIWLNTVEVLPPRVFSWVHHAYLLLRACILYSHTSMYPGQLRDPAPDFNVQVSRCAKEILHATGMILSQVRREVRFVVLPLFLAGVFTQEEAEKELALNLISAVEPHSYGGCVQAVRALLEAIFRKQRASVLQTGVATSVDWVEEMELSGQRLIISGL